MVKCDQYVFYNNLGFSCVKVFEFRENLREKRDRVKKSNVIKALIGLFLTTCKMDACYWSQENDCTQMVSEKNSNF